MALQRVNVDLDGALCNKLGETLYIVAKNTSADVIRMIVSNQCASETHALAIYNIDDAWDVPRRIDYHTFSLLVIADKIDEVGHLPRKGVRDGKIASGQKLSYVETHRYPPLAKLLSRQDTLL